MEYEENRDNSIQYMIEFAVKCGSCKEYVGTEGIRGIYVKLHGKRGLVIDLQCTECGTQETARVNYHDESTDMEEAISTPGEDDNNIETKPVRRDALGAITTNEIREAAEQLKGTHMKILLESLEEEEK